MLNPISSILRSAFKDDTRKLQILSFDCHEGYQTDLAHTQQEFISLWQNGMKKWDEKYRPKPNNYITYDISNGLNNLPENFNPDIILMQNRLAHGKLSFELQQMLPGTKIIGLEHCEPLLDQQTYEFYRKLDVEYQVFITEESRNNWGYNETNSIVINHGIDINFFKPDDFQINDVYILSVANEFITRGQILGFDIWKFVVDRLPHKVVGNTPNLSKAASSVYELRNLYQSSKIFLNTSIVSPIPHSLLEAAACGSAIITTATCAIPSFFKHEENCLMSNDPKELRKFAEYLISNQDEVERLGKAARETVLKCFNIDRFTHEWNRLFRQAIL